MLLGSLVALTLLFSVVSTVNPGYFAGLRAYADYAEKNDERSNQEDHNGANLVQTLGDHSEVAIKTGDNGAVLGVRVQGGDLQNGTHSFEFNCTSPLVSKNFSNGLVVEGGQGEFREGLALANGTYSGCEFNVGNLSASFPSFTVQIIQDDGQEKEDQQNDSNNGQLNNKNDDQQNDVDDHVKEKRKEKSERIASTLTGSAIHERHRKAHAESPGVYAPNSNFTLTANGTAMNNGTKADSEVNMHLAVWKSNRAIVLLDVLGGTVDVGNQSYKVLIGYGVYSANHDAVKIASLAVDKDGNVMKLELRGSAIDEESQLPKDSGSVNLMFEGSTDAWNSKLGDWKLELEGTLTS